MTVADDEMSAEAVSEGTELRSVQDVLSIRRDTRTLGREGYPARISMMRRVKEFLSMQPSPLDPGHLKGLGRPHAVLARKVEVTTDAH
jgi:hypothetical protein